MSLGRGGQANLDRPFDLLRRILLALAGGSCNRECGCWPGVASPKPAFYLGEIWWVSSESWIQATAAATS
jgi:hypothetical protein